MSETPPSEHRDPEAQPAADSPADTGTPPAPDPAPDQPPARSVTVYAAGSGATPEAGATAPLPVLPPPSPAVQAGAVAATPDRPARRRPWRLIAGGLLLFALGFLIGNLIVAPLITIDDINARVDRWIVGAGLVQGTPTPEVVALAPSPSPLPPTPTDVPPTATTPPPTATPTPVPTATLVPPTATPPPPTPTPTPVPTPTPTRPASSIFAPDPQGTPTPGLTTTPRLTPTTTPALAPFAATDEVSTELPVNFRAGPGTTFPTQGGLTPGTLLAATGNAQTVDGILWREFRLANGTVGWVRAQDVSPVR